MTVSPGVVFPTVDLTVNQNLDVAVGLMTQAADARPVQIRTAEQQSSLKMNEHGARAEAVIFMNLMLGVGPPPPPELLAACRALPEVEVRPGVRCPTGQSRITSGFQLPARHVIHTVGPIWRGDAAGEPEHRVRSMAFPAISCGVFG